MNDTCERWAYKFPKAAIADHLPENYALVLGPLVDDDDAGRLGGDEFEFLRKQAGAIILYYEGEFSGVYWYEDIGYLFEVWAEYSGNVEDPCEVCGFWLCRCPEMGLGEGSAPWG